MYFTFLRALILMEVMEKLSASVAFPLLFTPRAETVRRRDSRIRPRAPDSDSHSCLANHAYSAVVVVRQAG